MTLLMARLLVARGGAKAKRSAWSGTSIVRCSSSVGTGKEKGQEYTRSSPREGGLTGDNDSGNGKAEEDQLRKVVEVSVDRSSLFNLSMGQGGVGDGEEAADRVTPPEASTPMENVLQAHIMARGPLSVADFMKIALTHPEHGYYTQHRIGTGTGSGATAVAVDGPSPFGGRGDFTTSPEISQVFGELLGVWGVGSWMKRGGGSTESTSPPIRVVEIGPGRGTLLCDLLRSALSFPAFLGNLCSPTGSVHLVEASPYLQEVQEAAIRPLQKRVREEHGLALDIFWHQTFTEADAAIKELDGKATTPGSMSLVLAHELLDALPVHQFEWHGTEKGWRERLVDLHLSSVRGSPGKDGGESESDKARDEQGGRFRLVAAPGTTPAEALLHSELERARRMQQRKEEAIKSYIAASRSTQGEGAGGLEKKAETPILVHEVSPISLALVQEIAEHIAGQKHGGAGLLIDYGFSNSMREGLPPLKQEEEDEEDANKNADENGAQKDNEEPKFDSKLEKLRAVVAVSGETVRGIRKHRFVPFLEDPGNTDISADVNFDAVRSAVGTYKEKGVSAVGPVTQRELLQALGIEVGRLLFLANLSSLFSHLRTYPILTIDKSRGAA